MTKSVGIRDEVVTNKIYLIRSKKVMLDMDLVELYGVETKQLKRAVKRNLDRFPEDFMFELNDQEFKNLRSQFGTSRYSSCCLCSDVSLGHQQPTWLEWAFPTCFCTCGSHGLGDDLKMNPRRSLEHPSKVSRSALEERGLFLKAVSKRPRRNALPPRSAFEKMHVLLEEPC